MSALQKILDKPYGTRTLLEQCISDAVTLEDEHDGDYTRIEQAAAQLAQMQDELELRRVALADILEPARALVEYRDRAGALNFQLEKADDFINMMRVALEKKERE